MSSPKTSPLAPAAFHAIKIIELLANEAKPIGISEIGRKLDLNVNMVYRVINTLENNNWVYSESNKYQLTLRPFQVVCKARDHLSINSVALPYLYDLWERTGESFFLAVKKDDMALYLQNLDSTHIVRIAGSVGGTYPLYCTAPGKILLAFSSDEYIEKYCSTKFKKYSDNTITKKSDLIAEINKIKEDKYAIDNEEFGRGLICYAVPIWDYTGNVIGTLGMSTLLIDHTLESMMSELAPLIDETAHKISLLLGYIE